ncbi:MAG: hypothetical protein R3C15_04555 [Thermoleophilia bacterium]
MRRTTIAALAATASLVLASTANAEPPFAFGGAKLGPLTVTTSVLPSDTSVDMRGVWNDPTVSCLATRQLIVKAEVFFTAPGGGTRRIVRSKRGAVGNCAEGGPNFGFTIPATTKGLACADGTWRPGTYSFVTFGRHVQTGLRAYASLNWRVDDPC